MNNKIACKVFFAAIFFPMILCAQKDTVFVLDVYASGGKEGTLNDSVNAVMKRGRLSTTVFKLDLYGRYILTDSIVVPAGDHLTIVAEEPGTTQQTAMPQILCTSASSEYSSPVRYMFYCYGDLTLKNLWLLYINTNGWQVEKCIIFQDVPDDKDGRKCEYENVIIDYSGIPYLGGGSITVACNNFRGTFRNCYWKNCNHQYYRYYGRAVSFPFDSKGWYGDSLIFENCTFANIGYVLMQEGGEYYDHVKFNHCTFLNVVMYSLESGWWNKLSITNCIFVNAHMFGHIPAMDIEPYGGTLRIDSLSHSYYGTTYTFPFTEQDRRILFTNSSYYIEKWLRDWIWNNPGSIDKRDYGYISEIPIPQLMLSPGTLRFFDST